MRNRFASSGQKKRITVWRGLLPTALFVLILGLFYVGLADIGRTVDEESLRSAQNAVAKAAVQCYALEGQYPPNTTYLREHYGLSVDEEKYIIHYELFASNIMPQIMVFPRNF